jgi:hypothetical protein
MQPTAQAVGKKWQIVQPQRGERTAAILKSGTRGERSFRNGQFIPYLFAKHIFPGGEVATKIAKKAKIKLLICNELRIWKVNARVVKSLCG